MMKKFASSQFKDDRIVAEATNKHVLASQTLTTE